MPYETISHDDCKKNILGFYELSDYVNSQGGNRHYTATNTRMTIIMTPNIQKPKVVSVLPEKHNIVYAVAQKHEKAVMLLHYFVISWLEEGDLRVWIHYRYSTGVKKLPRY